MSARGKSFVNGYRLTKHRSVKERYTTGIINRKTMQFEMNDAIKMFAAIYTSWRLPGSDQQHLM
jgi:hypothetical protein